MKETINVLCGGASHASEEMLTRISAYNKSSDRYEIQPGYVDIQPQRLASIQSLADSLGVQVRTCEARIEDVLGNTRGSIIPVVLHVDDFGTIARVLTHPAAAERSILGYFIISREDGLLRGMRFAVTPEDAVVRHQIADIANALATVTMRVGSSDIIGADAPLRNRLVERRYRYWFADHLLENLPRVAFGLPPNSSPIEASVDGRVTTQVIPVDSRAGWRDLPAVSGAVLTNPTVPVRKGALTVAEIGPDGTRLHSAKSRKGEQVLRIDGCVAMDPETITDIRERARIRQAQEEEARRRKAATITATSAIGMTD